MNRYIDIYCERLEPGLWAEPLNAVTNAAFFIAAFFAWRLLKKSSLRATEGSAAIQSSEEKTGLLRRTKQRQRRCSLEKKSEQSDALLRAPRNDVGVYVLIFFIVLIGTGSTLFHTHATMWAQLSDVMPILFYQIAFLAFYSHGVLKFSKAQTVLFLGVFFVVIVSNYQLPHHWLNGSIGYAPALLFLIILTGMHYKEARRGEEGVPEGVKFLGLACLTFVVSLTFRSIDMELCEVIPLGTHFMWHVLNGVVLYLTTASYIKSIKSNL